MIDAKCLFFWFIIFISDILKISSLLKVGGGLVSGLVSKVFIFLWLKTKILPKIHRKELKSLPKIES